MLKKLFEKLFLALALALAAVQGAQAAGTSAWTGGTLNSGLAWTAVMGAADMTSLANGSAVLSTVSITNGTGLDQFADFSGVFSGVTSGTPPLGSYIGLFLIPLDEDGTTWGNGEFTSGSTITRAPAANSVCSFGQQTTVATTVFAGACYGVVIPPGTFRIAVYNLGGQAFSATNGNSVVSIRSYDINLNR